MACGTSIGGCMALFIRSFGADATKQASTALSALQHECFSDRCYKRLLSLGHLCPANGRPAARARRSSSSPRAANRARRHAGRYTSTRGSLLALVCSLSGDAVCVTALGHTRTVHRTPSQQTCQDSTHVQTQLKLAELRRIVYL